MFKRERKRDTGRKFPITSSFSHLVFINILTIQNNRFCSGLSKMCPQNLRYVNDWPPAGGTVWKRLNNVALLEEVSHGGELRGFQRLEPIPVNSLCFWFVGPDVKTQLLSQPPANCHFCSVIVDCRPWKCTPKINPSFYKLSWPWCFITANRKVTRTGFTVTCSCMYVRYFDHNPPSFCPLYPPSTATGPFLFPTSTPPPAFNVFLGGGD